MGMAEQIAELEDRLDAVCAALGNTASRATLVAGNDADGAQRHRLYGFAGEELTDVQLWQPFGLSAHCPPGGDVLLLSLGGNRDGAQALAATHPSFRPTGQVPGGTTLYDAGGQKVVLGPSGITISDQFGSVIAMTAGGTVTINATSVEITSDSLTHNGKNIGDTHVHSGVIPGGGNTGAPA